MRMKKNMKGLKMHEKMIRNKQIGLVHIAAKKLFGDLSDEDNESLYRQWLLEKTGHNSCSKLNNEQLNKFVKYLKDEKIIQSFKTRGGNGITKNGELRPTKQQWAKIAGLARSRGWQDGLEDKRLQGFVKRTLKIETPRFMTRKQATDIIIGLERWSQ